MPYKIVHEIELCIGCGTCVALCPKFWELKGNKAHLKGSKKIGKTEVLEISDKDLSCNKEAVANCPVQCISIKKI